MNNRYYVYEWFLKSNDKVFYVGKGTGKRYNHIIDEIKTGKKHGLYYSQLQTDFGIDYRLVKDNLTNDEALALEEKQINIRKKEGNFLIQYLYEPNSQDFKRMKYYKQQEIKLSSRKFKPCIEVPDFYKFYYGMKDIEYDFDKVTKDSLKNVILHEKSSETNIDGWAKIDEEKSEIIKYILRSGGSFSNSITKNTTSFIEFNNVNYEDYKKLKANNICILHAFDVLEFIKKNPLEQLNSKVEDTEKIELYNDYNFEKQMLLFQPKDLKSYIQKNEKGEEDCYGTYSIAMHVEKETPEMAVWYYEASLLIKDPYYYYPCYRLAVIYKKNKMYKEYYRIIQCALKNSERDKSYFVKCMEQLSKKFRLD